MVRKKGKNPKNSNRNQQTTPGTGSKKTNVSDVFLDELKGAFTNFAKIPESHRIQLYGKQEYLEQFREYFKYEHPNLLDTIDKKDLPVYIQALENKGFSLANITKNTSKLHNEFKADDTESHVMEQSLSQLQKFCEDKDNNIPADTFRKFADAAGFTHNTLVISPTGKFKTIDDLYLVWKKFLEKENITLGETSAEHAERILTPEYNPTERMMVTVALTKIRKELKGTLKTAFDVQFPLPIDIFSPYQDLLGFKAQWTDFLNDHAAEIDESLAKKLDGIIVTNGDIQKELSKSGRKFDDTRGFSEREQYFRRIFNKLVTRQLFEEVQKTQESIDHYLEAMGNTFKEFPPYVNEILKIYPFNDKNIGGIDPSFHTDLQIIDDQILASQEQYSASTDAERKELRKKIQTLKQEREQRRRQAYITFLRTKDAALADIFAQLVANKFDFAVLSADHQQLLVDALIKHKLEDTIKNKVPELLSVTEKDLTQFVNDLFDLKKMDLIIPTKTGPVPLSFTKKEFLSSVRKELPALNDLEDIQNLPLNFVAQLTESNSAFFENSPIFDSIYTDFTAKNGKKFRINDAYKVRIKKDGKTVEGYLSAYSPIDEKNNEEYTGKELYLYSEPITSPNQERKLLTREGTDNGVPVVIKDEEQQTCDMEILDRKINLNGEAFGALLFGYVIGQQSMVQTISPQQEKALAEKFGKLNVYKEKEEGEEEIEPLQAAAPEKSKEASEYEKFMNERKHLKGYSFPEEKYKKNDGFMKGTRLFISFADSEVPPLQEGKAWLQMEIIDINETKGTFKVKIHGGELGLGKSEGATKELPLTPESLLGIKKAFGENIYKLPDPTHISFADQMNILTTSKVADGLENYFGKIKYDGGRFKFVLGDEIGQDVEYFGRYDPKIGENPDEESGTSVLYKIKHNINGTFTVSGEIVNAQGRTKYPSRDMDYATFMIFVQEKGLQPKSKKQAEALKKQQDLKDQETPTTVRGFSINNVISFFKNGASKLKDSIKKYDEERAEDLTDLLTSQGQLRTKIGGFLSPFSRVSSSFEAMGAEHFLERDNRIRKKVEKRQKFYEDQHFATIYRMYLDPLLKGKVVPTPHYKIAALLLTMIKKGKGPYNRNPELVGKGTRINIMMGPEHQARYLAMRDKRIRELEQNGSTYPGVWTDQVRNELVELEMKYIVHVIDGRQLGLSGVDNAAAENYFCGKYSRKFSGELEGAYTEFFKQETVEGIYNKIPKTTNFEFARFEYFRLINERPQQAIPYLKVMAEKAITKAQRQTFEYAVLSGMLAGIFLNMTFSDTSGFIQKICRTRGFLPGLRVRDFDQQTKVARLLDIISDNEFSKSTGYKFSDFKFGNMPIAKPDEKDPSKPSIGGFFKKFNGWLEKNPRLVTEFLELTGKAKDSQTLVEMYHNPKTSPENKMLLEQLINKSLEKDEDIDQTVKYNPGSLTGSVFTKSQSVVDEIIKYSDGHFSGKDKDEIQSMQMFRKEVAHSIPKGKESDAKVEYFLKKFINRFEGRGFSDNDRTIFVRRLRTASEEIKKGNTKQAEDILRYTIVGTIIKNSGRGGVPDELRSGLEGFKSFFTSNIDTILKKSMIRDTMGSQYVDDSAKPYVCGNRAEYVEVSDPSLLIGLSPQERKEKSELRKRFKNPEYINEELFKLAERLQRDYGITNNFKTYYINKKSTETTKKSTSAKATGAKIKNPEVVEKVRRILEGKSPEEDNSDEFLYQDPEDYFDY